MNKKGKTAILLEEWEASGKTYHISQVRGTKLQQFYGKVYCLCNEENRQDAIIYEREIQALSGPPGRVKKLLKTNVGDYTSPATLKSSLEKQLYIVALDEAKKIACSEQLIIRRKI